jgi:hypothetical protein
MLESLKRLHVPPSLGALKLFFAGRYDECLYSLSTIRSKHLRELLRAIISYRRMESLSPSEQRRARGPHWLVALILAMDFAVAIETGDTERQLRRFDQLLSVDFTKLEANWEGLFDYIISPYLSEDDSLLLLIQPRRLNALDDLEAIKKATVARNARAVVDLFDAYASAVRLSRNSFAMATLDGALGALGEFAGAGMCGADLAALHEELCSNLAVYDSLADDDEGSRRWLERAFIASYYRTGECTSTAQITNAWISTVIKGEPPTAQVKGILYRVVDSFLARNILFRDHDIAMTIEAMTQFSHSASAVLMEEWNARRHSERFRRPSQFDDAEFRGMSSLLRANIRVRSATHSEAAPPDDAMLAYESLRTIAPWRAAQAAIIAARSTGGDIWKDRAIKAAPRWANQLIQRAVAMLR